MIDPRTSADLQKFMTKHGISGEIITLSDPTPTVDAAARALGVNSQQIVKSVLFSVKDDGILTISCGEQFVEQRVIARIYGVGRKRVKLASPELVLSLTGYAVGTVPPFGHPQPLNTLLDPNVLTFHEVFAGGGSLNAMVRLNPQDIAAVTQAKVVDLHSRPV